MTTEPSDSLTVGLAGEGAPQPFWLTSNKPGKPQITEGMVSWSNVKVPMPPPWRAATEDDLRRAHQYAQVLRVRARKAARGRLLIDVALRTVAFVIAIVTFLMSDEVRATGIQASGWIPVVAVVVVVGAALFGLGYHSSLCSEWLDELAEGWEEAAPSGLDVP